MDKLDLPEEKENFSLYIQFSLLYSELFSLIQELNNTLNISISSISSYINKIKDDSNIKILKIANLKLEFLIDLIKNNNIINIKIKLIEIMIFHL